MLKLYFACAKVSGMTDYSGWVLLVVSGHRRDYLLVWWFEAFKLLCAYSVTCANGDFPQAGYLQLILAFGIWGLLGSLKVERVVLGTHLYEQKWDWGAGG